MDRATMLYDTLARISNPCEELLAVARQAGVFSGVLPQHCHFVVHAARQCMLMIHVPTGVPLFVAQRNQGVPVWIPPHTNLRLAYDLANDSAWPWGHHQAVYDGYGMLDALRAVFALLPSPRDLFAVRRVCRQWRDAHDYDSPSVHERWSDFIHAYITRCDAKYRWRPEMERQWYAPGPVPRPPPWARYAQYTMVEAEHNPQFTSKWWTDRIRQTPQHDCRYYVTVFSSIAQILYSEETGIPLGGIPLQIIPHLDCWPSDRDAYYMVSVNDGYLDDEGRFVALLRCSPETGWSYANRDKHQQPYVIPTENVIAAFKRHAVADNPPKLYQRGKRRIVY
jgi:hypothetical protein